MTQEQLNEAAAKLEALVEQYDEFQSVPISDTIADAIKAEWNLEPVHATEFSGAQLSYHLSERRADRKRLIRFGDAMEVLQELEEALIDRLVRDEADLLVKKVKAVENAFGWLADNWSDLGAIWHSVWDHLEAEWKYISEGAPHLIARYTLLFSLPMLIRMAKTAVQIRDLFPDRLRKKALPQRVVRRRYRRKVSRL